MQHKHFDVFYDESDDLDTNGWYMRPMQADGSIDPNDEIQGPFADEADARQAALTEIVSDELVDLGDEATKIIAEAAHLLAAPDGAAHRRAHAAVDMLGAERCMELLGYDPFEEEE